MQIRPLTGADGALLDDFLYLAIYQDLGSDPLPRSVTASPDLAAYIEGWGRPGDLGFVALAEGEPVGAAWARLLGGAAPGYGYVDEATPELSVSVRPDRRGAGIGSALLRRLLAALAEAGYPRVSLSVQKANPALRLYERLGFVVLCEDEAGESVVMTADT